MPQQIDVPGMGIVEFPDGMDDNAIAAAIKSNMPAPEKPFLEKLGNFWRNLEAPPSIAAARDAIKGAPAAATELTWGADPQAAEQAAGTIAQGAQMGLGFRGLGGEGVFGRRISTGTPAAPVPTPVPPMGASQQAVEAGARLPGGGVTLPGFIATEGTVMPQLAAGARNVPWAGQPIVRAADELTANLGRAAGEIAPGAGTAETAGQAAKSGLTDYIKAGAKSEISDAYKAVDALIDPEVRVPLTNTAQAVAEMRARRANAMIEGDSNAIKLVAKAVKDPLAGVEPELRAGLLRRNPELGQTPGLNYQGVKDLRANLGDKTDFQLAAEGINPKEGRFLYKMLTRDLGKIVSEAGGPEAYSAWRKANVLHTVAKRDEKKLAKILGVASDAGAEAVFNKLVSYANSKAGADMGRLRLAKRAMDGEAWSEIAPVIIDRLGKAAPDMPFSPDRFVTQWGNMSNAAKNELFTGQQYAALTDLFTVSSHVKDRITRFGNPSGTARGLMGGLGGSALWAEPITAIVTITGTRLLAEALARPAVVRAATAVARAQLRRNPVATRRAQEQLYNIVLRAGLVSAAQQRQQERPSSWSSESSTR